MSGPPTLANLLAHNAAVKNAADDVEHAQAKLAYKQAALIRKQALAEAAKKTRLAQTQTDLAKALLDETVAATKAAEEAHDVLQDTVVAKPDVLVKRERAEAAAGERAAKRQKKTAEDAEAARAAGAVPPPVGSWWERTLSYGGNIGLGGLGAWITFG